MMRRLVVTISAKDLGKIKEDVQIVTKSDIFKLKVEAEIVSAEEYDNRHQG
jgi:hypothetical protein